MVLITSNSNILLVVAIPRDLQFLQLQFLKTYNFLRLTIPETYNYRAFLFLESYIFSSFIFPLQFLESSNSVRVTFPRAFRALQNKDVLIIFRILKITKLKEFYRNRYTNNRYIQIDDCPYNWTSQLIQIHIIEETKI